MKQTKQPGAAKSAPPVEYDWSQHQTTGFERTNVEDLGVPFLAIVQKGSPEVDKTHKDYATKRIPDVEVGSIINTVTRQIVHEAEGEPVLFVPCFYEKLYAEWKPRDSGGGFVRHHRDPAILNECTRSDEDNRDYLASGNVIVTTGYFYGKVLIKTEDGTEPQDCVISMASTQLKKARLWLNMMMAVRVDTPNGKMRPPMFAGKYHLTTVPEQNAEGSWYGWHVESAGFLKSQDLISDCAELAKRMTSPTRLQLGAPATAQDGKEPF